MSETPAIRLFPCLVSGFWLLAFILSLPIIQPYELARLGAVGFICLGSFLLFNDALKNGLKIPKSLLLLCAGLFWLNALFSIFWSAVPFISLIGFATFSLFALGFFTFALTKDTDKIIQYCAMGVGLIISALGFWALLQHFFLPEWLVAGQVRYPFANPNSYAGLLSLGFLPILGLMLTTKSRLYRNLALTGCMLTLGGIIVISGRAVCLSLLAVTLIFLFLSRAHVLQQGRHIAALLLGMFVLFLLFILVPQWQGPLAHLSHGVTNMPEIASERLYIWQATAAMIRDHFPFGTGIGTFFLFYPEYRLEQDLYSGGLMAHNDPLQFAAEMGWMAPLFFYLVLIFSLWRMIKTVRLLPRDDPQRVMIAAVFCALGAMMMHAHVSFPFYVASLLTLSGLMLGWWYKATGAVLDEPVFTLTWPGKWPDYLRWTVIGLPFLVCLFALQAALISEFHANRAKSAAFNGNIESFQHHVNAAFQSGHGLNARAYLLAVTIPLGILQENDMTGSAQEHQNFVIQIESLLNRAYAANPRLVGIPYYRATLHAIINRPDVEALLTTALTLDPRHLPSRMMLADRYIARNETARALEILKDGLPWAYIIHDPFPYYNLTAMIALQEGDIGAHRLAIEKQTWARLVRKGRVVVSDDSSAMLQ